MDGRIVQVRPGQDDWEFQRDLAEGHAAILMVEQGSARSVELHNFRFAAEIAPLLVPLAQRQQIALRVDRNPDGMTSLIVGARTGKQ